MMTATKVGKYGTLTVTYETHADVGTDTALAAMTEHRDQLLETARAITELIDTAKKFLREVQA